MEVKEDKLTISLFMDQAEFLSGLLATIVREESLDLGARMMCREIWQVMVDAAVLEGKVDITDVPPPKDSDES